LRWVDEDTDVDLEQGSISSEEAAGSGSDSEIRVGARNAQDIWNRREVEDGLRALPGSEELSTLLESGDEAKLVKHTYGQTTGLLLASWRGNSHMLATLLDFGASPSVTDAEGRYNGSNSDTNMIIHHQYQPPPQ
jgi:hypothetical protein